ncbi:hypothetical protein M407DRAFT_10890 [Tulasnella calospora MUT 4182]|uniref:Uncharacterized protein n=1 Tax=Tulasnella calospora MUT 4182 TaxID=1051891 RepID=A0A0C3Q962_9AGAM|nr:hypothetical protein M407DRAFT_10890 [Tulasnella calospora MUT 4182]
MKGNRDTAMLARAPEAKLLTPSVSYRPPSNVSPEPVVALAHASNLSPERHAITVRSVPKDGKNRIEIDGAEAMNDGAAKWIKPTSDTRFNTFGDLATRLYSSIKSAEWYSSDLRPGLEANLARIQNSALRTLRAV